MAIPNPSQQPYVFLTELKAHLNIADTNTTQDVFLTNISKYVQRFIDRHTGRTFGWGDAPTDGSQYDSEFIDYSNTDNIGIISSSLNGSLLTLNTMGPMPWVKGEPVQLFGQQTLAWNGVWAIQAVNSAIQIVLDISTSAGSLGLSALQTNINYPGGIAKGFVGNYVQNYRYITQEQHDGIVGNTIYLRSMDIRSVDTLYIGLRNVAQPVLLDHTQYVWRDDGRVILGGAYFNTYDSNLYSGGGGAGSNSFYGTVASGYQTIQVSYWAGYTGVPDDIKLAALDLCTALYALRKALGLKSERIGDYQAVYDDGLRKCLVDQPDSLNILNTMRRRKIRG